MSKSKPDIVREKHGEVVSFIDDTSQDEVLLDWLIDRGVPGTSGEPVVISYGDGRIPQRSHVHSQIRLPDGRLIRVDHASARHYGEKGCNFVTVDYPLYADTEFISNGSGRVGSLGELLAVLKDYQLDPGNNGIAEEGLGRFRFYGNFLHLSHVFNVRTSHPTVIDLLRNAVERNREREDYKADVAFREKARTKLESLDEEAQKQSADFYGGA